jgi:hypothetical protein
MLFFGGRGLGEGGLCKNHELEACHFPLSPALPSNKKALEGREKFFKIYLISYTAA